MWMLHGQHCPPDSHHDRLINIGHKPWVQLEGRLLSSSLDIGLLHCCNSHRSTSTSYWQYYGNRKLRWHSGCRTQLANPGRLPIKSVCHVKEHRVQQRTTPTLGPGVIYASIGKSGPTTSHSRHCLASITIPLLNARLAQPTHSAIHPSCACGSSETQGARDKLGESDIMTMASKIELHSTIVQTILSLHIIARH